MFSSFQNNSSLKLLKEAFVLKKKGKKNFARLSSFPVFLILPTGYLYSFPYIASVFEDKTIVIYNMSVEALITTFQQGIL